MDREILGKIVDELIKKKALPVETAEELNDLREKSIKELDDEISTAIFGSLDEKQSEELGQLLDRDEINSDAYANFFKEAGLNVEEIIAKTMQSYSEKFLGGENV